MNKLTPKIIGDSSQSLNNIGRGSIPLSIRVLLLLLPKLQNYLEKIKKETHTQTYVNKAQKKPHEFIVKSFGIFGSKGKIPIFTVFQATNIANRFGDKPQYFDRSIN